MMKVFNDILLATDSGDYVILVLLDLTMAFDTVDHSILISCRALHRNSCHYPELAGVLPG